MKTLLNQTLKALGIEYTDAYANKIYNAHPYRYTFYGLQQMLSAYNIEVLGIRVEKQEELLCLDTPFLAELNRDSFIRGEFLCST